MQQHCDPIYDAMPQPRDGLAPGVAANPRLGVFDAALAWGFCSGTVAIYAMARLPQADAAAALCRPMLLLGLAAALTCACLPAVLGLRQPPLLAGAGLGAVSAMLLALPADFTLPPPAWVLAGGAAGVAGFAISLAAGREIGADKTAAPAVVLVGHEAGLRRVRQALPAGARVVMEVTGSDLLTPARLALMQELLPPCQRNVIVVVPWEPGGALSRTTMRRLGYLPATLVAPLHAGELDAARPAICLLGRLPVRVVQEQALTKAQDAAKLWLDRAAALALCIAAFPVIALAALAIGIESGAPILFWQERAGQFGQPFRIVKFRTMRGGTGHKAQTSRGDARCTRVGAVLRRTSIDELPQLWNVLVGEMSLVGPRPHADELHAQEAAQLDDLYRLRQRMRPGLTGWAQIHGSRGGVASVDSLRRRVEYDLDYIDNWSFWLDLRILLRTPWCILRGENAF